MLAARVWGAERASLGEHAAWSHAVCPRECPGSAASASPASPLRHQLRWRALTGPALLPPLMPHDCALGAQTAAGAAAHPGQPCYAPHTPAAVGSPAKVPPAGNHAACRAARRCYKTRAQRGRRWCSRLRHCCCWCQPDMSAMQVAVLSVTALSAQLACIAAAALPWHAPACVGTAPVSKGCMLQHSGLACSVDPQGA